MAATKGFHDWNISFDGVIQCQKCWKYVDEGVGKECYATEHPRADCEGCGDPACPCNRETELESLRSELATAKGTNAD